MKYKTSIILVGIIVVIVVLLVIGRRQAQVEIVSDSGTEIPCLPNGHQTVASHIHPDMALMVDGENEPIPANIGISGTCMREVHTHDTSGRIHIETAELGVIYTLADFFTVWGQEFQREGYDVEINVDGEMYESATDVVLEDGSQIAVEYTTSNE